ncbi:MAG: Dabb family protein [Ginsengibacter sp.]
MEKLLLITLLLLTNYTMTNAQEKSNQPLLRHVVLFGWKDGTDTNQINKVVNAFKELPSKISLIKSFEWGTNNSPEGLNGGLTHCFFVTFTSEADRDTYLVHPAHKEFVGLLNPAPDKVTVVDYWAK